MIPHTLSLSLLSHRDETPVGRGGRKSPSPLPQLQYNSRATGPIRHT